MKDILSGVDSLIPKPKKKDLMKEENIVFHHQNEQQNLEGEMDMERQRELEAYRRRFEEAMIRIEDQEDVEAYNEAKAEIDDEFDEDAELAKGDKKEETRASGVEDPQVIQEVNEQPEEAQVKPE